MIPSIIKFELISRHPKFNQSGKELIHLNKITALRYKLHTKLKPTHIRVRSGSTILYQENLFHNRPDDKGDIRFFNIWLNLEALQKDLCRLTVEFRIFGFYVKLSHLDIKIIDYKDHKTAELSDSYIDISYINSTESNATNLVDQIINLPATIRCSSQISNQQNIKEIALLRLDQLGDFVMTTTAIHELITIFPRANITILVSPSNEGIANSIPYFKRIVIIPFSFEEKSNIRTLKKEACETVINELGSKKFDLAIDLSPMPETRELLRFINADYRVGFENTDTSICDLSLLLHAKDPINWLSNVSHANYPRLLISSLKNIFFPEYIHLENKSAKKDFPNEVTFNHKDYIVIHSGARNKLVQWPEIKFVELAETLSKRNLKIVFFADDDFNHELRQRILKLKNFHFIQGLVNFKEFDAIISLANLFIGNDSGPKHLAAMRGTPVVSLHSARTNWNEWGQIDSGNIVSKRVPCAGCAIVTSKECTLDQICIKSITINDVLAAIGQVSKDKKSKE
ncbi:MAG TPA: hypothetical protein DCZ80_00880 [Legionellales bacterium]|nr:hypothetical protein [Legionellales bacterium]